MATGIMCFSIRLFASPTPTLDLGSCEKVLEINCDRSDLTVDPLIIAADPFLFVRGGRLYLFYEHNTLRIPGVLRMVSTRDLRTWTEPVTVLAEPYHLSFPFVFEDEGQVYMIPETGAAHRIRLYRADDDSLTHFTWVRDLLWHEVMPERLNDDYADSVITRRDGRYYLMTTLRIDQVNQLHLYHADRLQGPYAEHPQSPVVCSNRYGRNGGCCLDMDGRTVRVAQDCQSGYGDDIHLLGIDQLSATAYGESVIRENVMPRDLFPEGGHQFNVCRFAGKYVYATDAKEYHSFLLARALRSIKRRIHNTVCSQSHIIH